MQSPLVSVVIPYYNAQRWIEATLASVFAQTYGNFEVIVVDDGSASEAAAVLQPYVEQGRIRYVRQPNRGPSAARNEGVRQAKGRYIAFLDADDLWVESKLEEEIEQLAATEAALVFSDSYLVGERQEVLWVNRIPEIADNGRLIVETLFGRVAHFTSSLIVRKDALLEIGGFAEELALREDHLLLMEIAARFRVSHIPRPLTRKRVCAGSLTSGLQLSDPDRVYRQSRGFVEEAIRRMPWLVTYRGRVLAKLSRSLALSLLRGGRKAKSLQFVLRATTHHPGPLLDWKTWALLGLILAPGGRGMVAHLAPEKRESSWLPDLDENGRR